MDVFQGLLLGIVQGLTEFLPVSSSAHLVIVPAVFGWESHGLAFDVLLHMATSLAVIVYFRRDLLRMTVALLSRKPDLSKERRLALLILTATVPTVAIALSFGDFFERLFLSAGPVGLFLLVTSAILFFAEKLSRKALEDETRLSFLQAVFIGAAQGAAVTPGISRSGATIAAGLALGLTREEAARFSFLLSVPIVLAATLKTAFDVFAGEATFPGVLPSVVGFVAAAVSGYLAIAGLLAYLRNRPLYPFVGYTAVVGLAVVLWQYVL